MDLSKFLSLLLDRSLHFARGDTLGDPFEGSVTQLDHDLRAYIIANRHTDARLVQWRDIPDEALKQMFETQAKSNKSYPSLCYVSCWHMNEYESAAMWRQSDEAICIQSTFKRLQEGLPSYVHAGEISYIDYERGTIPVGGAAVGCFNDRNFPPVCTENSFAHERELRAIILGLPEGAPHETLPFKVVDKGVPVPIDLEQLIETIRVSPTSKTWFKDVVSRIVTGRGLNIPVLQSSLSATPLY